MNRLERWLPVAAAVVLVTASFPAAAVGAERRRPSAPPSAPSSAPPVTKARPDADWVVRVWELDGGTEEAERLLRELVADAPARADVHLALGRFLAANGRFDDARIELERSLDLAPRTAGALEAQLRLDAMDAWRAVPGPAPVTAAIRYDLLLVEARAAAEPPQLGLLEALVRRAIEIDPARWEIPALAGRAFATAGRHEPCRAALEQAVRVAPEAERADLQQKLATCGEEATFRGHLAEAGRARATGQRGRAADEVLAALRMRPAAVALGFEAANDLVAAERFDEAAQVLGQVEERGSAEEKARATALRARVLALVDAIQVTATPTPAPALPDETAQLMAAARKAEAAAEADRVAAEGARAAHEQKLAAMRAELDQKRRRIPECERMATQLEREAERTEAQMKETASKTNIGLGGALLAGGVIGASRVQVQRLRDEAKQLEREVAALERELAKYDGN